VLQPGAACANVSDLFHSIFILILKELGKATE
jgi:hypothetical protein